MSETFDGSRYPVVECLIPVDDLDWACAELYDLGTVGIEELEPKALLSFRPTAASIQSDRAGQPDPVRSESHNTQVQLAPASDPETVVAMLGIRAGFPSEVMAQVAAAFLAEGESERMIPWQPIVEFIVGDDWLDAWREHFEPLRSGQLVVAPAWKQHDGSLANDPVLTMLGAEDTVVWLEPGRAWGTGAHASTSLCLLMLQRYVEALKHQSSGESGKSDALETLKILDTSKTSRGSAPGFRVLDVGCGSGVLAVAALMLGASTAYGIDIDESSPSVTLENAKRNCVGDRCTASTAPIDSATGEFTLVFANILAPVLIELAQSITNRVAPGGVLLLAGLIEEQRQRVLAAYPEFLLEHVERNGEWVGLMLRRPRPNTL